MIQFIDPSYNFLYLYCDFGFYLDCVAFDFADSPVTLHNVRYILLAFGIIPSFDGVESNLPIVEIGTYYVLSVNACTHHTHAPWSFIPCVCALGGVGACVHSMSPEIVLHDFVIYYSFSIFTIYAQLF